MIEECLAVEFEIRGDDCPLAEATRETGCRIDASPPQLRADGNVLLRFSARPDRALREVLDADDRIRYLHVSAGDDRETYRCLSKQPCVVHRLISTGCIVEELQYREGNARLVGAVVGRDVLQAVMERAGETVGVSLRRAHVLERTEPVGAAEGWDLTPKQAESLGRALAMGYYAVPRETTAAEVAADLGIGKSAFLERLRRGERRVFEQLFG